jgi:hypothetical protein
MDRISNENHENGKQFTIKSTGMTYTQHVSNHGIDQFSEEIY